MGRIHARRPARLRVRRRLPRRSRSARSSPTRSCAGSSSRSSSCCRSPLLLVWFGLTRGLAPLADLQARIRARQPDDLSPIDARGAPEEIAPLVSSFNEMLERLVAEPADAAALPRRRRAPDEDAAGGAAHAGRAGAARDRSAGLEEHATLHRQVDRAFDPPDQPAAGAGARRIPGERSERVPGRRSRAAGTRPCARLGARRDRARCRPRLRRPPTGLR